MHEHRLYVASSDRVITGYDMTSLRPLVRLEGHSAYVYSLVAASAPIKTPIRHLVQVGGTHTPACL
jgi:hypothetical protein